MKLEKKDLVFSFNEKSNPEIVWDEKLYTNNLWNVDSLNVENNSKELTKAEKKEIKNEVKQILKKEEESKKDIWIKIELSKAEKIAQFFNKIEFLWLDNTQKEEVAKKVRSDALWDKLYWIEIFLSSWIAALWLLQNSVAVVIWAMLIAPLLRPINGLSFAIARWAQKFFVQAFWVLVFSIIASVFMWLFITFIVWLNIETNEILARTSPNIIDFFIAVFSAMVAVMSLRFTRLWESVAWVAMAASLMPPLAVVWIELYIWNFSAALWAFTLFWANLIAILFVWTVFFWLYWFTPHDIQKQTKVFKRIWIVLVILLIILTPLYASFNSIKTNYDLSTKTKSYLTDIFKNDIWDFVVSDVFVTSNTKNSLELKIVLRIPEWVDIKSKLSNVIDLLSNDFWKKVKLDIEIVRVLKLN